MEINARPEEHFVDNYNYSRLRGPGLIAPRAATLTGSRRRVKLSYFNSLRGLSRDTGAKLPLDLTFCFSLENTVSKVNSKIDNLEYENESSVLKRKIQHMHKI